MYKLVKISTKIIWFCAKLVLSTPYKVLKERYTITHNFKNQTGSLGEPEKPGTSDLTRLFSAQDRPRHQTRENLSNSGPTAGFRL
jgi:hypothetical protein